VTGLGARGRPELGAAGWAAKHSEPIASQQRYVRHKHQQKHVYRQTHPLIRLATLTQQTNIRLTLLLKKKLNYTRFQATHSTFVQFYPLTNILTSSERAAYSNSLTQFTSGMALITLNAQESLNAHNTARNKYLLHTFRH